MDKTGRKESKRGMVQEKKIENGLFVAGWCVIGVGFLYWLFAEKLGFHLGKFLLPCVFHQLTGIYCPGCGGTRASIALLQGHFIKSFLYHPFVPYTFVVGGWFLLSQTIERLSRGKVRIGMRYRDCYLWISLVIIGINVIVKDALLLGLGVDVLAKIG